MQHGALTRAQNLRNYRLIIHTVTVYAFHDMVKYFAVALHFLPLVHGNQYKLQLIGQINPKYKVRITCLSTKKTPRNSTLSGIEILLLLYIC